MTKAIKISDENYKWLRKLAGNLQAERGQHVSIDEAIVHLKEQKGKLSDLAGKWALSDRETSEMLRDLRKGWKSWKPRSA